MNKKQLLIAAMAIMVLGLIYLFSSKGRTVQKSVDADLLSIDSASVHSLSIINNMDTVKFIRRPDRWQLEDYDVNTSSFNRLFSTLTDLKLDRFVSKNIAKYSQYGVDSTATRVLLSDEMGNIEKDYFIGNVSSGANETFIRENGQQKIYSVLQNLGQYSRIDRSSYWKQEMITLSSDDVFSIQVEGNINFFLEHKNMGWTYNGELMDMKKGDDLINKISTQRASKVSKENIPSVSMLLATITITPRNGQPSVLKYFENDEKSTTVYVQLVGNPMRFEMYKSTYDGFDKKYEDLKPEEQAPTSQPITE